MLPIKSSTTSCCIVGGGPAGVMLGYLLARAGVQVIVLEKHADFLRDFRGDTVHPSTLTLLHELGLLDAFLRVPHQELTSVSGVFGDFTVGAANFRLVPGPCKFVALMPQWDFLDFLAGHASRFSAFQLRKQHEVVDLIHNGSRIAGVVAKTPAGSVRIEADLVVGCDGRHSVVRTLAGLVVNEFGAPIDVLWFRISRKDNDPEELVGNVNYGKALVLINRSEYFQAGFIIAKGSFERIQQQGLAQFQQSIVQVAPYLGDRVHELRDWDQIKLLSVQMNRLQQWHRDGLLCIGDAAHAMSPAGGVGINLAIQDAVATANLLTCALRAHRTTPAVLARVQARREFPTRVTQWLQAMAHRGLRWVFRHPGPLNVPWIFRVISQLPGRKYLFGYLVGVGIRPEHARPKLIGPRVIGRKPRGRLEMAAIRTGAFAGSVLVVAGLLWRGTQRYEIGRS